MKRILPIILVLAVFIGTFAPITASISQDRAISIAMQDAQAQTNPTPPVAGSTNNGSVLNGNLYTPDDAASNHIKGCGIIGGADFVSCFTWIIYYVPFVIGNWVMSMAAQAFDASAKLTLSSTLYTAGPFLKQGWQITRDFANIFFILILLFIALSLVLDMEIGHANPKKMLILVVVIAIMINFSFFLTEVVIDISNSLALVFYNQVVITSTATHMPITAGDENTQLTNSKSPYITQIKPLSIGLVRSFTPQVLSSAPFYAKLAHIGDGDGFFSAPQTGISTTGTKDVPNSVMIPLLLMIGLMFCFVAYSFGVALISLIARLLALWIAIIFSPFAFVSFIVPSARSIGGFGWDEWIKDLMKNAFAAPVYFFFILLISILAQTSIIPANTDALSPGLTMVLVFIQFTIICGLLYKATQYVKESSGKIGEAVFKGATFAGKAALGVAGAGVGIAAGGAALLGRKYVGFLGKSFSENTERKKLAAGDITEKWRANNKWAVGMTDDQIKTDLKFRAQQGVAKRMIRIGRGAANASFDVRNNAVANMISDKTGIGFDSFGMLAAGRSAGGYNAKTKRDAEKKKAFADSLEGDHAEQVKLKDTRENNELLEKDLRDQIDRKNTELKGYTQGTPDYNRVNNEIGMLKDRLKMASTGATGVQRWTKEEVQAAIDSHQINDATGNLFDLNDVGTVKHDSNIRQVVNTTTNTYEDQFITYQASDVGQTTKANGKLVNESDVNRTIKAEYAGTGALKKAEETVMKAMGNSYLHYTMLNSGYKVEGMKLDAMGNIKELGHYAHAPRGGVGDSTLDMTRSFARAMRRVAGASVVGAAVGTALMPGLGSIAGALTAGLGQVVREFRISTGQIDASVRGQAAAAASMAGDDHFKASKVEAKYKSPASGIFSLFKDLFKSSGGGGHADHGDGGHSQAGGGGHH